MEIDIGESSEAGEDADKEEAWVLDDDGVEGAPRSPRLRFSASSAFVMARIPDSSERWSSSGSWFAAEPWKKEEELAEREPPTLRDDAEDEDPLRSLARPVDPPAGRLDLP